ncbi:PAS domain-containing protein [Isoptericola jiangsuensis]|uniref:histidine kinase n=1 Tax=Isoptericola jiangsuensis TaxID=548579 RepID=A0A2A9F0W1_9MICO|nr:PAS domain-containing protein [Isoptericola jiangsuensis]PFG44633.1 PAS domain-containing protein [Isoptericola jiangsuensis]
MGAPPSRRTSRNGTSDIAEALATGTQLVVGRYHVDVATGHTWWSDETYRLHGHEPGEIEPSIDVILARTHPDDRSRLSRTAAVALHAGRPFASAHRIVDPHGRSRSVVVTGQGRHEDDGTIVQVVGYVLDVSPVTREALDREAQRAVGRALVSAAAVEQVKGAIMVTRGLAEADAADLLGEAAARAGVPLQVAASQVVVALQHSSGDPAERLESALATVHAVDRPRGHEAQLARRRLHDA